MKLKSLIVILALLEALPTAKGQDGLGVNSNLGADFFPSGIGIGINLNQSWGVSIDFETMPEWRSKYDMPPASFWVKNMYGIFANYRFSKANPYLYGIVGYGYLPPSSGDVYSYGYYEYHVDIKTGQFLRLGVGLGETWKVVRLYPEILLNLPLNLASAESYKSLALFNSDYHLFIELKLKYYFLPWDIQFP